MPWPRGKICEKFVAPAALPVLQFAKLLLCSAWEALLLSGSETLSRGDLMRGLGAWYVNVQRPALHWLLYGKEYHTMLMEKLRLSLPSVLRDLRRQRKAFAKSPSGQGKEAEALEMLHFEECHATSAICCSNIHCSDQPGNDLATWRPGRLAQSSE
eukprot:Skav216271  [mRNA]  locus=scaffold1544:127636:135447:- [translate_table: standard]